LCYENCYCFYFSITILISSCKDSSEDPSINGAVDTTNPPNKKGIGLTSNGTDWSSKISTLKVDWYYGWRYYYSPKSPSNVLFVPMDWGGAISSDALISYWTSKKAAGELPYILGFNEPDGVTQANLSVQKALELWPRLQQLEVPLGSPATVNPENSWMLDFMLGAIKNNYRVDFVCMHNYGGTNPQAFLDKVDRVYNLYKKPIWITEFAVGDWTATTPAANKYSQRMFLRL
jgi:Glycosyl hydrolase catalytic core.